MTAKKTVELQMKVDDQVKPGLDSTVAKLEAAKKKIAAPVEGGGVLGVSKSANEQLGRIGQAMVIIAAGAAAVEAGIKGWEIASATFSGDAEKRAKAMGELSEQIKTLPFGIGGAVKAFESLLGVVSGIRTETEAINASNDKQNQQLEYRAKLLKEEKQTRSDIAAENKKLLDAATSRNTSIRDRIDSIQMELNPDDFGLKRGVTNKAIDRQIELESKTLPGAKTALDAANSKYDTAARNAAVVREQGGGDGTAQTAADNAKKVKDAAQDAYNRISANIASLEEFRVLSLFSLDQKEKESRDKKAKDEADAADKQIQLAQQVADKKRAIEDALTDSTNQASKDRAKYEIELLKAGGKEKEASRAQILEDFENEIVALQKSAARVMEDPTATQADRDAAQATLGKQIDTATSQKDLRLYQLQNQPGQLPGSLAMNSSRFLTGASDANPVVKQTKTLEEILGEIKRANDLQERKDQVDANANELSLTLK